MLNMPYGKSYSDFAFEDSLTQYKMYYNPKYIIVSHCLDFCSLQYTTNMISLMWRDKVIFPFKCWQFVYVTYTPVPRRTEDGKFNC